jgi:serine/threonine protein kinase/tetratricopeptide (TPR) repeat protein
MDRCLSKEQIAACYLGTLPADTFEEVGRHLEQCPDCQAMAELVGDVSDQLVVELKQPVGQYEFEAEPELQRALTTIRALGTTSIASRAQLAAADDRAGELRNTQPPVGSIRDYELLEPMGHGGMGAVYKARHTRLNRIVALKILPEDRRYDPAAVRRFEREMHAVGKLKHPNIVHAYDAGEEGGRRYLVMEYTEGIDVSRLCHQRGPLRVADACELVRQAALGLQHAHEHGLVHRDIKPSNLLLTPDGQVKVLDLGLALLCDAPAPVDETAVIGSAATHDQVTSDQPSTDRGTVKKWDWLRASTAPNPGNTAASEVPVPISSHPHRVVTEDLTGTHVMGTCDYMAPEQTRDAHAVDIRADIYGLGCTLYKLLAGRAPFESAEYGTAASKLMAHVQVPAPPIRQQRSEVSEQLAAIVDRMLAKEPAARFATPAEVAAALEPYAAGSELAGLVGATVESPSSLLGEGRGEGAAGLSPPRRRLALAAGGAAAIILLGIVILVSTGKGTVKLEFADVEAARQCTVSIDGDEIRVENLGEPIKLRPGKHTLRLRHGELEVENRKFDVVWRGAHVLHVSIPEAYRASPTADADISKLQRSIARLEEHCEHRPQDFSTLEALFDQYYRLGESLYARGRNAEAKAALEKSFQYSLGYMETAGDKATARRLVVMRMSACPIPELRNPAKALKLAREAFEIQPGNHNSLWSLGLAHYRAGNWTEAVANLKEWSERRDPTTAFLGYFLAMAYWQLGEQNKARRCFEEVTRTVDDVSQTRPNLAARFRAEAAQLLGIAGVPPAEPPKSAQAYAEHGRISGDREDWWSAIAAYDEAIRLEPSVAEHYIGRGQPYFGTLTGPPDRPIADFSKAIELNPGSAEGWVNRGGFYYRLGELEKAKADFEAALRINPRVVEDLRQRAENRQLRRWRAICEYMKAAYIPSALVEWDKRDLERAIRDLRTLAAVPDEIGTSFCHRLSWWLPTVLWTTDKPLGIVFASDMPWVQSTSFGGGGARRNAPLALGGWRYQNGIRAHAFDDARPADVVLDISGRKFAAFKTHVGLVDPVGSVQFQVLVDGAVKHESPIIRRGTLRKICVDVAGAKQIVLRVLNSGDGNISDSAGWGLARFVQAGAEDPLEVPPAELESATDANAALFLAEVHWRLDRKDLARRWYDKAAQWMDKNKTEAEILQRYRAEAAQLLVVPEKPSTAKTKPEKPR